MRRVVMLAAIVGLAVMSACDADPSDPTTPSPVASTQSPVVKPTPTPDAQQQALIDSEQAYRSLTAESDRLAMGGGAKTMTPAITNTATGNYLASIRDDLQTAKRKGWHLSAPITIVGVVATWHETEVHLIACEDRSRSRVLDAEGKDVTPAVTGTRLYRQSIIVIRSGGRWKLSDAATEKINTFENMDCGQR